MKTAHDQLILAILIAVAAGISAAFNLIGLLVFAAAVFGMLGMWLIFTQPMIALKVCFFLLLVGQIKFRWRDPSAALSNNVDAQVMFELGMYGLVLFISLVNYLDLVRLPQRLSRNEGMLLLYVVLAFLSIGWSVARNITAVRAVQLAILYFYCFCAVRRLGPAGLLRNLGLTILLGVLLLAAMAATLPFANGTRVAHTLTDFSWSEGARFTWFAEQPINAGAETGAAIVFLFCCAAYFREGWKARFFKIPLWAFLPPLALVLAATRARGPLFATIVGVLILSLRRHVQLRLVSWVAVIAGLTLLLGALNANTNALTEPGVLADSPNAIVQFILRGQSVSDFTSMSGRSGLWEAEESLFARHPIFGYGYVASRGVLLHILPWAGEAHNALGETALDLGFVGVLILWVPLMMSFLQSLLRRDPYHSDWNGAVVAALLAFMLVDGISESGFTGAVSYLSIVLFAAMFAHRDGWGTAVQERVDRSANYAVNRAEPRNRAWALQRPTGGAV